MIRRMVSKILSGWHTDAPASPRDPGPDFTSDRARKYHESNQLGRN